MWTPQSWQNCPLEQQADYPDSAHLERVITELSALPPLVSANEINQLKARIAAAGRGEAFLLQGGDCAESFSDCKPEKIHNKLNIMLHMSVLAMYGLGKPVTRIGRMAGQYAKPRSAHTETQAGLSLPAYRGDLINDSTFSPSARQPDPERLLKGYSLASLTLNYIRSHAGEQLGQLLTPAQWQAADLIGSSAQGWHFQLLNEVQRALALVEQLAPAALQPLNEFYTCHEALHLHYEQSLSRPFNGQWYNLSTHMPWVGMRTAKPDSGHIEYLRGIANPIAIKVGPRMSQQWLEAILDKLNPLNEPGRISLITRMGAQQVEQKLPPLIEAVQRSGHHVTWICDPMHGNTEVTSSKVKTRHFDNICAEMASAYAIHQAFGSILGGIHLELTGESVTECIGGACSLTEDDLSHAYHSLVDPRLNARQALELTLNLMRIAAEQGVQNGFSQLSAAE
ncbi:MAG: 3-deoxy-7-phosphoheptulonate synthase [Gammaproteobacteria bacterium]|nr:3-deoxy-7-phosphoheptulonate synthase [Gammaproteobacteria bacterium]NVK88615.1 3-deoxy-7-phosphoheptulonate synthase [Gammaproteobacteria bacterium]